MKAAGTGLVIGLHHVQLSMPRGGEAAAVAFYAGVLGLAEVAKPDVLAGRGGVWFAGGGVAVHLGVEDPFRAARKAHPAFEVVSVVSAIDVLDMAGVAWRRDVDLPGIARIHVDDPFGNRIELLERRADLRP